MQLHNVTFQSSQENSKLPQCQINRGIRFTSTAFNEPIKTPPL